MSAAVYSVYAAHYAAQESITVGTLLRELGAVCRSHFLRPKVPQLRADGWHPVYSTWAAQWARDQATFSRTWRGQLASKQLSAVLWLTSANKFSQRRPLATGCVASTLAYSAGDCLAQRIAQKNHPLDCDRAGAFGVFGLAYCGYVQHFIYGRAYPFMVMLAKATGGRAVALQLVVDNCIHIPFLYLPCFYVMKGFAATRSSSSETACASLSGGSGDVRVEATAISNATKAFDCVTLSLCSWRENVASDVSTAAAFWVPANALNFYFVPTHYRVLYLSGGAVLWVALLSSLRGGGQTSSSSSECVCSSSSLTSKKAELDAKALSNYELFHGMPRGTATYELVIATSAGLAGWAQAQV